MPPRPGCRGAGDTCTRIPPAGISLTTGVRCSAASGREHVWWPFNRLIGSKGSLRGKVDDGPALTRVRHRHRNVSHLLAQPESGLTLMTTR